MNKIEQNGTKTGRFSCKEPNLSSEPKSDKSSLAINIAERVDELIKIADDLKSSHDTNWNSIQLTRIFIIKNVKKELQAAFLEELDKRKSNLKEE